jgi:hypothetical protein
VTGYSLSHFVLVNANTDQEVRKLVAGETLIVDSLNYKYNIIAVTESTGISFVQFYVNETLVQKETNSPYALCGDTNGNYAACTSADFGIGYGTITLRADSFFGSTVTSSISITFTIKQSARRLRQNTGASILGEPKRDNYGALVGSRPCRLVSGDSPHFTADQVTPVVETKLPN